MTTTDDWSARWRRMSQKARRRRRRRFDYYPDPKALDAIRARVKATGESWCAAINALVNR